MNKTQVKKAIRTAIRHIAINELFIASVIPKELQFWGATRTAAWIKLAEKCQRAIKAKSVKPESMLFLASSIRDLPNWSIEQCNEFISKKAKP